MPRLTDDDLTAIQERTRAALRLEDGRYRARIVVHMGTCGIAAGAQAIMDALRDQVLGVDEGDIQLTSSGCAGLCVREPMVTIERQGELAVKYADLNVKKATRVFNEHVLGGQRVAEYVLAVGEEAIYEGDGTPRQEPAPAQLDGLPWIGDVPFFRDQVLLTLANRGRIDPDRIDEYIAYDGYRGVAKALLTMSPEEIVEEVFASGLRGRGGGGFPTGLKWRFCAQAAGDVKYVLCNADEGDPGAFMDRSILEGDPHAVLEGMIIAAKAIGSHQGFIYVRAEYPLAIQRLQTAIAEAKGYGLLGEDILGSGFAMDIELYLGAGAFVCGEETALMQSIEGKRGMPRPRPPFPAHKGLWARPSILNNVESFANVPRIIHRGAPWFASLGTGKSKGSKVFALTGRVVNNGLIEVPMGTALRKIVYDIGGGIPDGRSLKAVQIGGPSGGCLPARLLETSVDYESIVQTGAIVGSGGMVVMDDTSCMVDVAKFFLCFTAEESCGKCTPCRVGTSVLLKMLTDITEGRGREGDIERLEALCEDIIDSALCGLGQTAPNPVLTTLRYFREEYEAHIRDKRCPAGVCKALITYTIDPAACNGCTLCAKRCPEGAISGARKEAHVIDPARCTRCGLCYTACKRKAIEVG